MNPGSIKEFLAANGAWIATTAVGLAVLAGVLIGISTSSSGNVGSTIQSAETVYKLNHGSYGTADQLQAAGNLTLPDAKTKVTINLSGDGSAFCAVSQADGGKPMWSSSDASRSSDTAPTVAGVTCPTAP